ncbi:MAG: restriction endonuclease [Trichococcus flocculiformis]|uniref:site-specific DNA-methyltransferase (adenine-specific) n=1 Tax=Trichococcus flocculiformis TaxID=82803 RepID=A0A847D305_9LACT|nr:Eco57I restriction-modification methylase domain-containing protein [Trichococcus flocculiformis]NLD31136.1 restriction endonuclease [Trichococcus flocculiformis]
MLTSSRSKAYNPDVLNCLANLSNDEVFTPPEIVNAMLDTLPQYLFGDSNARFLDLASKSGVFLREIAKRLIKGLEPVYPDLEARIDHIFRKQLYGIAITELTALMSRRSLYCSKYPNSIFSVIPFENIEGNIRFKRMPHRWKSNKCVFCGAAKSQYERDKGLETHSYEFIHTTKPEGIFNMKFDVIIGNPPYQLETDGPGKQAKPIYHHFVRQAKKLQPRYLIMITPSRWFAGGMGLDDYRAEMLSDKHIRAIVDYSKSTDCFPGVDIAGGVSYFSWESTYNGLCEYTYIDGESKTVLKRDLNEYEILVRNNEAIEIVRKVTEVDEKSMSELMSSLGPFGLGTAERGEKNPSKDRHKLLSSEGISYIDKSSIKSGFQYLDKWKVVIGKATSAGAATAGKDGLRKVIATLELLEPNAVCTFSYFVGAAFDDKKYASNCRDYLSTKFARFLLLQTLSSINITKNRFVFVPQQDFSRAWTDEELYVKYCLCQEEINLIESMIKPMNSNGEENE